MQKFLNKFLESLDKSSKGEVIFQKSDLQKDFWR